MSARKTLARQVAFSGTALHAGVAVRTVLSPAPPGQGVVFLKDGKRVCARYDMVAETRLGTVLESGDTRIAVVEHLMAALAGAGLDDVTVTVEGPEPPILDGDALCYLAGIEEAGVREQGPARRGLKVVRKVEAREGDAFAALHPASEARYDFLLEYPHSAIGRQSFSFVFSAAGFREQIAPARTFGFVRELEKLHRLNLARGASLENTLALDDKGVMNKERQRFQDEFVRHKILDAIGDMALAGAPLIARFEGVRSGHGLNNRLLRALFADPANYQMVTLP